MYATIGAWEARAEPRLEFLIAAERDQRHVELATMTAWYHGSRGLGVGHTFPIGRPWLQGSTCEFLLVSLPYPFGPELEVCKRSFPDEALGPPLCRIYECSATGPLPPSAPDPPSLRAFARRASMMLGWWVRGLGRPTPFFDERTKAPRSVPRLLTHSERGAV